MYKLLVCVVGFVSLLVLVDYLYTRVEIAESDMPKVLLSVDNTWFHRAGFTRWTYVRALRRAGLNPVTMNFLNRALIPPEELLDGVDGVVLAGGGDVDPARYGEAPTFSLDVNSARDEFELAILDGAYTREMPVLAICRGAQLLNVSRGGSLKNLRSDPQLAMTHRRYRRGHAVELEPDSRIARYIGRHVIGSVTSLHGQAVDRLGEGLVISGYAPDGVVEAIETKGAPGNGFGIVGVQWHPEIRLDRAQSALFAAFARSVKAQANQAVNKRDTVTNDSAGVNGD